jgi:hypothetical protein
MSKTQPNKNDKPDKDLGMEKYAVVQNPKEKEAAAKAAADIKKSKEE